MASEATTMTYSVANTFIQFPAPRSESLEEFLQRRSAFSCPASRMLSLEEDPCDTSTAESVSENELMMQWPATRGPSLDDEEEAANLASKLNAAVQKAFDSAAATAHIKEMLQVPQAMPPRWASIEDDDDLPEFLQTVEKAENMMGVGTEAFAWPATRGPSLDEFGGIPLILNLDSLAVDPTNAVPFMPVQPIEFLNTKSSAIPSDASTTDSTEDHSLTTPPSGLSDDEGELVCSEISAPKDSSATLKISLTDTLGLWSIGSAAHETGTCKPCAFLWKDPKNPGCQNGQECTFCHLCPPGEVKARKKQKMFMRKMAKNAQYMDQYAMGFEPHYDSQYQNQCVAEYGMW